MVTDRLFAALPRPADQAADGRPTVVLCRDGGARPAVRRDRMSDLPARDVLR